MPLSCDGPGLTSRGLKFKQLHMDKRVTLKQIAAKAKVHLSTVSLALRNDSRLPLETRQRLQALARKMGYTPDAAMSALAAYRSAIRPHDVQSGLAYLSDVDIKATSWATMVYTYAKKQAAKMGYNLIQFNLDQGMTLERLQSIWWNTGLRGVLIGPFRKSGSVLGGSWDRWPTVAYGHSIAEPSFNRAEFNHFQNMLNHLEVLHSKGYHRIGLCMSQELSNRTQGSLHAAYLLDQSRHPESAPIPLFGDASGDFRALEKWVTSQRLDAIISYANQYHALRKHGWKIPKDIGFSLLSTWGEHVQPSEQQFAGMDTKAEILAETAISFLISLIHEQAYGLLNPPRTYMISGEFQDGATLRK